MIKGSVPAYSLYGESATRGQRQYGLEGAVPAAPGGMPYLGHTSCMANEETCRGARAKGTDFCIGHLRSMAKDSLIEPS